MERRKKHKVNDEFLTKTNKNWRKKEMKFLTLQFVFYLCFNSCVCILFMVFYGFDLSL